MVLLSEQTALQCQFFFSRTLYKDGQSNCITYIHTLLSSSIRTITSVSDQFIGPAKERKRKLAWCCVKHCLTQQVWCNGISQCTKALAGVWSTLTSRTLEFLYIWKEIQITERKHKSSKSSRSIKSSTKVFPTEIIHSVWFLPITLCIALRPCDNKGYSFWPNGHSTGQYITVQYDSGQ